MATIKFDDNVKTRLEKFKIEDFFNLDRMREFGDVIKEIPSPPSPLDMIITLMNDILAAMGLSPSSGLSSVVDKVLGDLNLSNGLSARQHSALLNALDLFCNGLKFPNINFDFLKMLTFSFSLIDFSCKDGKLTLQDLKYSLILDSPIKDFSLDLSNIIDSLNSLSLDRDAVELTNLLDIKYGEYLGLLNNDQLSMVDEINNDNSTLNFLTNALDNSLSPDIIKPTRVSNDGYTLNFDHSVTHKLANPSLGDDSYYEGYVPKWSIGVNNIAYKGTNIKSIEDVIGKRKEVQDKLLNKKTNLLNSLSDEALAKYEELDEVREKLKRANHIKENLLKNKEEVYDKVDKALDRINKQLIGIVNTSLTILPKDDDPKLVMDKMVYLIDDLLDMIDKSKVDLNILNNIIDIDGGISNLVEDEEHKLKVEANVIKKRGYHNIKPSKDKVKRPNKVKVEIEPVVKGILPKYDKLDKLLRYADIIDHTPLKDKVKSSFGKKLYKSKTEPLKKAGSGDLTIEDIYKLV